MCDDWAVRHTGQNVTLARCLVEVAGWMKTETRPVAAVGMAERGSPLVRRVERDESARSTARIRVPSEAQGADSSMDSDSPARFLRDVRPAEPAGPGVIE